MKQLTNDEVRDRIRPIIDVLENEAANEESIPAVRHEINNTVIDRVKAARGSIIEGRWSVAKSNLKSVESQLQAMENDSVFSDSEIEHDVRRLLNNEIAELLQYITAKYEEEKFEHMIE